MRHSSCSVLALVLLAAPPALAQPPTSTTQQQQPTPATQAMEIYHVHFVQAAAGKLEEIEKQLSTPAPDAAHPDHRLVLRHRQGSPWDYMAIEHIGPTATVEGGPPGPARELRGWHEDTFVAGPSWDTFAKAMRMGGQQGPSSGEAVYVVSTYRGAPGHRAQLEQTLQKLDAAAAKPGASVILQHVEGAAWDFLVITRYDSWQALAAEEIDPAADQREKRAGLTRGASRELREHIATHADTITVRVAPQGAK